MMGDRDSINEEIKEVILELPEEQKKIKEARVWEILDAFTRLLASEARVICLIIVINNY